MKKLLITLLVVVFTLSAATMAFAAEKPNPYSDVPAGHWAYKAVTDLYKSGVMEGWADKFHGEGTLTRYEIAAITARAMAKAEKADAATKAQIEKLATEFKSELDSLGVRVEALEKKAGNVTIGGEVRARYINQKQDIKTGLNLVDGKGTSLSQELRARVYANGQVNDTWKYWARFEGTENFLKSSNDADVAFSGGYIEGKFNNVNATLGRFDYIPVNGMVLDDTIDGAKLTYGEGAFTANIVYGRIADPYGIGKTLDSLHGVTQFVANPLGFDPTLAAVELKYNVDDNLTVGVAHQQYTVKPKLLNFVSIDEKVKINEFGATYKIDKDWKLIGSYSKTSFSSGLEDIMGDYKSNLDQAYIIGVSYKGADPKVAGTWGVFGNYRNIEPLAVWHSTYDSANILVTPVAKDVLIPGLNLKPGSIAIPTGFKGYEVGFDYAPYKNTKLKLSYMDGESTLPNFGKDIEQKYFQAQLEVFF